MPRVAATLIEQEETWDPQVFCCAILPILQLGREHFLALSSVTIVEGERWDATVDIPQIAYRMSNVGEFEMQIKSEQGSPPVGCGNRCVGPGDVIVTKVAPIRAAIATSNLARHPIDANCFLVRGLDLSLGFWLMLCLNQPAFGEYLVRKSGAAVVPRINANVFESLRLPLPPSAVDRLSLRVYDCIERRLDSQMDLFRFLLTVNSEVSSTLPDSRQVPSRSNRSRSRAKAWEGEAPAEPSSGVTYSIAAGRELCPFRLAALAGSSRVDQSSWYRFFPAADIDESLVPDHVAVNGDQHRLMRKGGWRSITELIVESAWGGARLTESDTQVRTLQLSDVEDDLTVLKSEIRPEAAATRRVYAEPLQENDVLLSALVSRSRVAFVGAMPAEPIYPTDHWHRLRFHETPGAWAAILNTPELHQQLERLAIGTVQQFAPSWMVQRLVLPNIPRETRIKWDSILRHWQQRRFELEVEWVQLMTEAYQLLRETHRVCGPWTVAPDACRGRGKERAS